MKYFTVNIFNGLIQGYVLQLLWSLQVLEMQTVHKYERQEWAAASVFFFHVSWISSVEYGPSLEQTKELFHRDVWSTFYFVAYSQIFYHII